MRNTLTILLTLVAVPFAFVACGDDTNNTTTGLSLTEFEAKIVDAACSNAVDCHRAETVADCKASMDLDFGEMSAAIEAGKVKYHPEKADACLEAFADLYVCTYSQFPAGGEDTLEAACVPVFEGVVALGGACTMDEMCVSGECQATDPMCSMSCCPSTCVPAMAITPPAKIGESCVDQTVVCEDGAYCKLDANFNRTVCAATVAVGGACTSYNECEFPGTCDLDQQTMMGTCKAPIAHGAACDPMNPIPCDRVDDTCDEVSKKCVMLGLPGDDCTMKGCVDYADCNMMGKCEKSPVVGEACVVDAGSDNCLGGLTCVSGKCEQVANNFCP